MHIYGLHYSYILHNFKKILIIVVVRTGRGTGPSQIITLVVWVRIVIDEYTGP